MEMYTTIQGDMWDSIAYRLYGNEKYMDILMKANQKLLDIFIFSAGTVLEVPALNAEAEKDLPPWR